MIKKIFKLLLLISFLFAGCFALGTDVPKDKREAYKKEMERIIDGWVVRSKRARDNAVNYAKIARDKIAISKPNPNQSDCLDLQAASDFIMSDAMLQVYGDLVRVSGRYFDVDLSVLNTDWYGGPAIYIEPYLRRAGVDMTTLYSLIDYAVAGSDIIDGYIKEVGKYCRIRK